MGHTLYQVDQESTLHRGAIFQYRPIFWLTPPLWLLRDHQWTPPRKVSIYEPSELRDAFRRWSEENQEDVIARAKRRYVIVLSNDIEAQHPQFREIIVAPTYTIDRDKHRPSFVTGLRQGKYPDLFYLPNDPNFPQIAESYIDFRKIQSLNKEFFRQGKLDICLSAQAIKAILYRYSKYLA